MKKNEWSINSHSSIVHAAGDFLLLTAVALLPSALVYIDVRAIGNSVREISITEITQEVLLLLTAFLFWYGAWRKPNCRGLFVLIAGFFSCLLVRELDHFFDNVWHGFWFWPATFVASVSIAYVVFCCRDTVIESLSNFVTTRSYFFIMIGIVTLLVFSRTFGSGSLLWTKLLGEAYTHGFKSALQEGLELYGYLFIAYGAIEFWIKDFDLLSFSVDRPRAVQQKHATEGDAHCR